MSRSVRAALLVALAVVAAGAVAASVGGGAPSTGGCDPATEDCSVNAPGAPTAPPLPACPGPLRSPAALVGAVGLLTAAGVAYARVRGPLLPAVTAVPAGLVLVSVCPLGVLPTVGALSGLVAVVVAGAVLLAMPVYAAALLAGGLFGARAEEEEEAETPLADVGAAAGRAADRIEGDADPTNEVYRAWRAMVRHLDVENPDATTAAEFADAAVAAGMDPDDVATLTDLFDDVRYGGYDPAARADRAVAALRRIERAYAAGGERA